jgi:hypothetical protein
LFAVADLCAGIGDDLLALAVIELLSYLERLGRDDQAMTEISFVAKEIADEAAKMAA